MIAVGDIVRGRTHATRVPGTLNQKRGSVTEVTVVNNKRKFAVLWDDQSNGIYVINAILREIVPPAPNPVLQIQQPQNQLEAHPQSDESQSESSEEEQQEE